MKKCVRIYIEGGAEGRVQDRAFRRGWGKFLRELHVLARKHGYDSLEIVRGKGRAATFQRFEKYRLSYPEDLCVLLVDSETAVPEGSRLWDVVGRRRGDEWPRPSWATERHIYFMVHFVETWLTADPEALRSFFKKDFDPKWLPTNNLEERSKNDIEEALRKATRGRYRHGQAHGIIEFVRPERVKILRHGQRLFCSLGSLIRGEPEV